MEKEIESTQGDKLCGASDYPRHNICNILVNILDIRPDNITYRSFVDHYTKKDKKNYKLEMTQFYKKSRENLETCGGFAKYTVYASVYFTGTEDFRLRGDGCYSRVLWLLLSLRHLHAAAICSH
jgi:hypothetical protein